MLDTIDVELPITIDYSYFAGEPQTRNNPGDPESVIINSIYLYNEELTLNQQINFIKEYGEIELEKLLIQLVHEDIESAKINAAI